jgi:hypothetical protein
MMTGGRELSRNQLGHYKESLCSKVEDDTNRIQELVGTTGEASQEPSHADVDPDDSETSCR